LDILDVEELSVTKSRALRFSGSFPGLTQHLFCVPGFSSSSKAGCS